MLSEIPPVIFDRHVRIQRVAIPAADMVPLVVIGVSLPASALSTGEASRPVWDKRSRPPSFRRLVEGQRQRGRSEVCPVCPASDTCRQLQSTVFVSCECKVECSYQTTSAAEGD